MVNFEIRYKSGYGGGPEEMLIEPLQNIYLKDGFCLNMIDTPLCPLKVMTNLQEAVWDADIVVNGLPSTETCEIFEETNNYWKERINPPIIISLSKGIEAVLDPVPRIITPTQMINWDAVKGNSVVNSSCRDVWTEYHDMGFGGIKAVAEYKAYIAEEILELHQFVAPKMMARGSGHFSYGITENLDNPKYKHYKYWFNPLETKLVPKTPSSCS